MNVIRRVDGTTVNRFTIALHGPTIWQGLTPPSNEDGEDGDLYVVQTEAGGFYSKVEGAWSLIIDDSGSQSRVETHRGVDLIVSSGTLVVVVRNPYTCDSIDHTVDNLTITADNDPGEETNVLLPDGPDGRQIIVKDESSIAGTYNVVISSSDNIDGVAEQEITTSKGFLELVYSGGAWRVVGA